MTVSPPACPFCHSPRVKTGTVGNGTINGPSATYRCLTTWTCINDPAWVQSPACIERAGSRECARDPKPGEVSIPIAEQLSRFNDVCEAAFDDMLLTLHARRRNIIALARTRLLDIGFHDYGDETWHKLPSDLLQDELEEHADALFYRAVEVWGRLDRKVVLDQLLEWDKEDWQRGKDCC